jgi:hypothetical protein
MNATLPTGRTGQIIAVLLLVLAMAMVWRLLASPLIDLYDGRRLELEQRAMQSAHLKALADTLPRLKATPGVDGPAPTVTLTGASDAVAAAVLQGTIQDMVRSVGASLGSVEILPAEAAGELRRIGLKVTLSGAPETVTRLLLAIEQAEPPMLLDELQIHGNAMMVPGLAPQPGGALRLDTSFAVYGFRRDSAEGRRP